MKWTDVARIVESLVAFNKYMTPKQMEQIPQYEKEQIAKGIYHFFRSGSDLPAIPFRVEDDYYTATENIVKQLSDTEKVKEILQTMQVVLDGTDTADRQYESMRKSLENLQKYSLGKFTLFNGKYRAEEKIIPETGAYLCESNEAYRKYARRTGAVKGGRGNGAFCKSVSEGHQAV